MVCSYNIGGVNVLTESQQFLLAGLYELTALQFLNDRQNLYLFFLGKGRKIIMEQLEFLLHGLQVVNLEVLFQCRGLHNHNIFGVINSLCKHKLLELGFKHVLKIGGRPVSDCNF